MNFCGRIAVALSFVCLWGGTASAQGQAFGIAEGTPLKDLKVIKENGNGRYRIEPNIPRSEFDQYYVIISPKTGVCKIVGAGVTQDNDAYGTKTKSTFNEISKEIDLKYGPSAKYDFLNSGSIWNQQREWAMSILKNERTLTRFWTQKNKSKLPVGVRVIELEVDAETQDKTYIRLSFEFDSYDKCANEINEAGSKAF